MRNWAVGLAGGVIVAVILAGGVVGALELWGPGKRPPPPPPPPGFARLGPDGTAQTAFGDDVRDVVIPGSQPFDVCYGEMTVQRPSMMTTDMPEAYCAVSRPEVRGPWRMSTGGWQSCQAVCVRLRP